MTARTGLGLLLVGAAVALAGCTSAGGTATVDHPAISTVSTPATSSTTPAPSTTPAVPSTPETPTSSAAATSSAPPSPPVVVRPSSAPPPVAAARSTCRQIGIRVIPGGATFGEEIAGLQFTNEGTSSCQLVGYASVTLMRNGRPVGLPSQPSTTAASERTLAPGEVAESLLRNHIRNCQAPLSDTIRVVAPGSTISAARPMQLRACVVRIDRLGAPD